MEINIKRSPDHWWPSEGSNSELFAHENDALTAAFEMLAIIFLLVTLNSN